ncbi:hypothetical protein CC1G_05501 [Coprinopsis cinerea okayama7|uniref:Oxysterol binding protein n=1 Tax=Coprinopsis cinerea (strain Okayama-7 / 130 / ATCC MYA-4618 / FGSC 9003) TaxID=240176 RepID=A8P5I0_COPC7|nr:hypothetical protein CC1G_05501 [Coprinopsis cinerea okayama7\|eukprot:XP_001838948.1 hypothetical protein CC1G_05501 [Coprinopsis cinerea okayama7\
MSSKHNDSTHTEDAAIAVPDSGDTGEGGKLKMIVQLVKKCLGVKDIASMRLSLPASLLEPIPNLEYWHYLDRADYFAAINDSNDPFERMLAVVRFTFTKDLRYVHGKVCKPYNSVLGEHFRAHWDVVPISRPDDAASPPSLQHHQSSDNQSLRSEQSGAVSIASSSTSGLSSSTRQAASTPPSSFSTNSVDQARLRVVFVTEQVSHHPPVSAYYASCPARHITMQGIDQISAKVTGTATVRVTPGEYSDGIFIRLTGGPGKGESYHITHPIANVNGILRGNFYVTICDSTIITCKRDAHSSYRTIIEYKEESWLGKAHFLVEGVIHVVYDSDDPNQISQWTKVKHVPQNRVAAVLDGSWRGKIRWKRVGGLSYPGATSSAASSPNPSHSKLPKPSLPAASASRAEIQQGDGDWQHLIDLNALEVLPKEVRPIEKQLPHESRKLWKNVTDKLISKEFSDATKEKHIIEQRQRDEAAERKKKGIEFIPRYFEKGLGNGFAELTEEGWKAVAEELAEASPYCIEGIDQDAQLAPPAPLSDSKLPTPTAEQA